MCVMRAYAYVNTEHTRTTAVPAWRTRMNTQGSGCRVRAHVLTSRIHAHTLMQGTPGVATQRIREKETGGWAHVLRACARPGAIASGACKYARRSGAGAGMWRAAREVAKGDKRLQTLKPNPSTLDLLVQQQRLHAADAVRHARHILLHRQNHVHPPSLSFFTSLSNVPTG